MFRRNGHNFLIALEAIGQNKLRSMLTSLGIIFGVAAVILMLAIARGGEMEIIGQLKFLGSNNIIIKKVEEQKEGEVKESAEEKKEVKRFTPGLSVADAEAIRTILPGISSTTPELELDKVAIREGYKRSVKLVGVTNSYFDLFEFSLSEGNLFTDIHQTLSAPVCIIGSSVKARFFSGETAIGKRIKVGSNWLTVVGVANTRKIAENNLSGLGIRDYDMDIYVPIHTALLRYTDRTRVSARDIEKAASMNMSFGNDEGAQPAASDKPNYHQVDRITVTVNDASQVFLSAEIIQRMLTRRHNQVVDFEIHIPEQILRQQQKTQAIFNYVLIAIAFISLLVGGIGIMNIMLASVMERIKEIGLRLSLGATKRDIRVQFLAEAVSLSLSGGLIGIVLGLTMTFLVEELFGIQTVVSLFSVLLSFFVSMTVGIIFGFVPARRAAQHDPVVSLRHE